MNNSQYESKLKVEARNILSRIKALIFDAEEYELTDTQWFINFEDTMNKLSTLDHNI